MNTITFDNTWAYLTGEPQAQWAVKDFLTFRPEGYQYTMAYKRKKWDGYKSLYHVTANRFPAGLTRDVASYLRSKGFEVEVIDTRPHPPLFAEDFAGRRAYDLMPHQQEAVNRIHQMTRGVVHHPVGAGKSLVIIGAVAEINQPSLVLVQRKELLQQQYQQFVKFLPDANVGMVGDGIWNPGFITVATIQTLTSKLRHIETVKDTLEWLRQWNAVFVDECHHLPAQSYAALLASLPNAYWRIGLSATPHRSGKKEQELYVTGLTGPVISAYDPTEGIEMGRLVPANVFLVDPGLYEKGLPANRKRYDYQDEVRDGIVENERRNALIVKLAEEFGEQGPTMVLTERIAHGKRLRDWMLDNGHEEVT